MLGTFPLAIGILASPIAVIPAILMLLGPRPKSCTTSFLLGLTMGGQGASTTEQAVAFGLFMLIGSIEVLLPLLAYIVAGRRAFGVLESARGWLERNNVPAIVTVVSVIGAVLLLNGVRGL
jgi:hypothetical protein